MTKENTHCTIPHAKNKYPTENTIEQQIDTLKALTDPTRIKILYLLQETETCSCAIENALQKPQPTISHHLKILKKAKLIKGRKIGTWIYYTINHPDIIQKIEQLTNTTTKK